MNAKDSSPAPAEDWGTYSLYACPPAELLATRAKQETHIKHQPSTRLCVLKNKSSCSAYYQKLPDLLDTFLAKGRERNMGLFQTNLFLDFPFTQGFRFPFYTKVLLVQAEIKKKKQTNQPTKQTKNPMYCHRDGHEKGSKN